MQVRILIVSSSFKLSFAVIIAFFLGNCDTDKTAGPEDEARNAVISTAETFFEISRKHSKLKDYDSAIHYAHAAHDHLKQIDYPEGRAKYLNNIGVYYYHWDQPDSSEHYYRRSLELDPNEVFEKTIATYKNLGVLYKKNANYLSAIHAYEQAKRIAVEKDNLNELPAINNNLGNLLNKQERYRDAIRYHLLVTENRSGPNDTAKIIVRALNGLGNDYLGLKNFDSARYYYHESLRLKKIRGDTGDIVSTLHNLGELSIESWEYDSAGFYLNEAYRLKKGRNATAQSLGLTANQLARLFLKTGNLPLAKHYLDTVMLLVKGQNIRDLLAENHELRSQWHEAMGQAGKALHYYKTGDILEDSLFQKERLEVLEAFAVQEKEEVERQKKVAELEALQNKQQADNRLRVIWGIVGFCVLLVASLIVGFFQYHKNKKLNKKLNASNADLNKANSDLEKANTLLEKANEDQRLLNREIIHSKNNQYALIIRELDRRDAGSVDGIRKMVFASSAVDDKLLKGIQRSGMVTLDHYLKRLPRDFVDALLTDSTFVDLKTRIEQVRISEYEALKIAFLIRELITNSIKHAEYKDRLLLDIDVCQENGSARLKYRDNGKKIDTKRLQGSAGMGWGNVNKFAQSLSASVAIDFEDGWNVFSFDFKI